MSPLGHSCNYDTAWINISENLGASYLLVTAMDTLACVLNASSNPTYAVMETSGNEIFFRMSCIYFHIERSLYMNEMIIL